MKKIEAFIRHESFDAIRDRLATMGLPSMSVSEVKGSGRQQGYTESYRGAKTTIFLRPKLKLEMAVDDGDVDRAVDAILELANGGCEAVINDKPVTDYILTQQPRLAKKVVHLPDMLSADDFAMVVAKDRPELAAELNAALKALKENGEFDKLMMKWFGKAK